MEKFEVLIAEDDESLSSVLTLMLEDDFSLTLTQDGAAAIDAIKKKSFHFCILDIHLPEKSGLEVCEAINELPATERPSVVILSGDLSDETINEAFSLGVGDYIGKPFNVVAFHQRLMRLSRDLVQIKALQQSDSSKKTLADTAMKQAAAYGSGLELLARLNKCHTHEQLMEKLCNGLLAQGYHCAVEFRHHDGTYNYDVDTRSCNENEKKVFQLLHDKGRIYRFGKRTIFNDDNASLLIKNMPVEGTSSFDSAIDLFAKLVPALGSRFTALMHVKTIDQTKSSLNDTIDMVTKAVSNMELERKQKLQDIAATIGVSFHELDLTEVQENFFLDLIDKKLATDKDNDKFAEVVHMLTSCAEKLHEQTMEPPQLEEADEDDDGIELF